MEKKRKVYSKEFKLNAIRMVLEEGKKTSALARDLGISSTMLHTWKKKYQEEQEEAFPGNGKLNTKDEYVRQ